MTTRLPVSVFFALFTISGFAGLIYESIWSHYLKLFLGHAAYAQTLVLAIFMGGMAIGSWLVSRYTQRIANLLMGYAFAELGIGILAILFHRVFQSTTGWAFDTVLPALQGGGVDLFKWTLASALILPASVLLGTTFPLMSGGIMRLFPESSGRALSMLYFTNSFGAALGVLASGFLLIDHLGLPGTILTAGVLNVTLALVVWLIARRMPAPPLVAGDERTGARARLADGGRLTRAVLLLAFATGAASFIYEITWIRMLTLGLGASTHAFEVMLAAFILAMSLGAFWFRNRIANLKNDFAWLAGLLIAKALLAVYAIWVYPDVLTFIGWMMHAVARTEGGYVLNTFAGLAASMLVMFPTAFCAGMTLPLATHALTSRGLGEASIGRVYGANTAGCIVGAAFATHVGMEALGVKGLTGVGALLDVTVGMAVLTLALGKPRDMRAFAAVAVVAAVGLGAFFMAPLDLLRMSSGVYRHGLFNDARDSQIAFYKDGKTATIAVIDTQNVRSIRTNGKPDASIVRDARAPAAPDEATMLLAAALPLAILPNAELIANIGFGSGLTTHGLLGSPKVKSVDSIEIERMMIEGARLFEPRNSRAYSDPRSHIHIEDAKTFFASAGRRYDVIVSEPSNPWVSGVSTLFSEEFYSHVKRYLKDDGVLVQWVQTYEIDLGLLSTIFNALGRHFGDYTVYRTGVDLLVVATPAKKLPPLRGDLFSYPELAKDLAYLGFEQLGDLEALRVGGRAALEPLFARTGMPPNSDFFPILDQRAPKARFRNQHAQDLPRIRDSLVPVLALLDGESRTPLERIQRAGVNRPARVDMALAGAEAIGIALGGDVGGARALRPQERITALLAHSLQRDCRGSPGEWVYAMEEVARLAMPVLEAKDVAVLFEKTLASPCAKSLGADGTRRIALLQAINNRDAAAIHEHSTFLLGYESPWLRAERAYYLTAALASGLATGRLAEAAALRDKHMPLLPARERESLPLRLVVSHLATSAAR
jgi:predicted membrane-bound spermidine synthase